MLLKLGVVEEVDRALVTVILSTLILSLVRLPRGGILIIILMEAELQ